MTIADISPETEIGPTGLYIMAGMFCCLACGVLLTSVHSRWSGKASWIGGLQRSAVGSILFAVGLLVMSGGLILRGIENQQGPLAGIVLWFFAGGVFVLVCGPLFDLIRSRKQ